MSRTLRESHDAAVRRTRMLRRIAPVAAISAAALPYALHHGTPLDGHGIGVLLLILSAAAVVAAIPAALARSVDRRLPVVVALRPDRLEVRPIAKEDLDLCTSLHAETLPHGFFAKLGFRFLRAYLATFVASPHAAALAATVEDAPVGFVVGPLQPRAHARWVMRHRGPRLALLGLLGLASRPGLAWRFARTRVARYRGAWRRGRAAAPAEATSEPAVLAHVAVAPGAQGAGLGTLLVDEFVAAARNAGCDEVVLSTLAGPDGAAAFYRSRGWLEREGPVDLDGRRTIAISLPLTPGRA